MILVLLYAVDTIALVVYGRDVLHGFGKGQVRYTIAIKSRKRFGKSLRIENGTLPLNDWQPVFGGKLLGVSIGRGLGDLKELS